ncbi:hydroxyethylthiazole kinase [Pseudoflavonifractor phocaeensis]|uniref:hydroxyethylthiazole kinase n=1 Tax=Pseudoflavonifractor phocaeensis TaxID=1870988 RepID=UPI0019593B0F|nr:hydroxyethylthiazole kinase [Pseudoflavonifractor phocaeensis]MBM6870263.1 hydroxyethylthiazole kinase [Pseudoflavonifractor phocaeensis]MBM6939617.1 hydroxyethylthiazole kinase [Pseudoflavonifractor phocaeensis]
MTAPGLYLDRVRQKQPLVHNITNYVTANDVANLLLAVGARPIMADDPAEAAQITAGCDALHLNLGTLSSRTVPSLLSAGQAANRLGHPVVLDPVGVGASDFRAKTARELLKTVKFSAVRGNISEIRTLAALHSAAHGVDADPADAITEDRMDAAKDLIRSFARRTGAVIAVTGAVDLVADGQRCFVVRGGRPEMGRVTGTGCQLSALTAAFLAANPDEPLEAVTAAVCAMDLAGELGWDRLAPGEGNMAYRDRIIDSIYHMTGSQLEKGARFALE